MFFSFVCYSLKVKNMINITAECSIIIVQYLLLDKVELVLKVP